LSVSRSLPLKGCTAVVPPLGAKVSSTLKFSFPFFSRIFFPAAVGAIGTFRVPAPVEVTEAVLISSSGFFPFDLLDAWATTRPASVAVNTPASGTFTERKAVPFFLFSVSFPFVKAFDGHVVDEREQLIVGHRDGDPQTHGLAGKSTEVGGEDPRFEFRPFTSFEVFTFRTREDRGEDIPGIDRGDRSGRLHHIDADLLVFGPFFFGFKRVRIRDDDRCEGEIAKRQLQLVGPAASSGMS
jgi:hypothetical protein